MKVEKIEICGPVNGLWKSHAICIQEGNSSAPIMYISRPKWIKDETKWKEIVNSLQLSIKAGTEII